MVESARVLKRYQDGAIVELSDGSAIVYLEICSSQIVTLQGFMELYEVLGIVRTVSASSGRICILTTSSMLKDLLSVLGALAELIPWRFVRGLPEEEELEYRKFLKCNR